MPTPLLRSVVVALGDIKLAHSVFALPFALAASFLVGATDGGRIEWARFSGQLVLVVLCMVCARTWAMLVNRLADHRYDAENPRTAKRAVAEGRLSVQRGWGVALTSAALFGALCGLFWVFFDNPWPLLLCVPVLLWIAFYSYTKRFTALCHLFLGGALAVSPLAAAIAIGGMEGLTAHWQTLVPLALFVLLWVGGFDVAYALQDLDFDSERGLHSVPAALGWRGALWASRGLHLLALTALVFTPLADDRLGLLAWCGVGLVGALLAFEHLVLHMRGLAGLPMAFFTLNGIVSVMLGSLLVVDVLL